VIKEEAHVEEKKGKGLSGSSWREKEKGKKRWSSTSISDTQPRDRSWKEEK